MLVLGLHQYTKVPTASIFKQSLNIILCKGMTFKIRVEKKKLTLIILCKENKSK